MEGSGNNIYQNRLETRDLYCKIPMSEFHDDMGLEYPEEIWMQAKAYAG